MGRPGLRSWEYPPSTGPLQFINSGYGLALYPLSLRIWIDILHHDATRRQSTTPSRLEDSSLARTQAAIRDARDAFQPHICQPLEKGCQVYPRAIGDRWVAARNIADLDPATIELEDFRQLGAKIMAVINDIWGWR